MLALQCFGLAWGILAAAAISSFAFILWGQPSIVIILTAETTFVGWLLSRRRIEMVLADALFWLFAGMPLIFLFYHLLRPVSLSNTIIIMTQLTMNGILNTLISRIIYTGSILWSRSGRTSLTVLLYNLLAFFLLCPALTMLAVESKAGFDQANDTVRVNLVRQSEAIDQFLKIWVNDRKNALLHLAKLAASSSPQQMQPDLELTVKTDSNNFENIGLLNEEATLTAISPDAEESGASPVGKNFIDRPYIPQLRQTLKPMLSEVIMGRIGAPGPIVTMLAPVIVQGQFSGFITGTLRVEEIKEYLDSSLSTNAMLYTLIDKNNNVILSNRPNQTAMKPFDHEQGTYESLPGNISQWIPFKPRKIPVSERFSRSFFVFETHLGEMEEWKLITEIPLESFQRMLYDGYSRKLTMLFLIFFCALLLTNNFRGIADMLASTFNKARQLNASHEQQVGKRTPGLQASAKRYRSIIDALPDGIIITSIRGQILMASPVGAAMFGYGGSDIGTRAGHMIAEFIVPEDRARVLTGIDSLHPMTGPYECRGLRRDGTTFDIEINHNFLQGSDGQPRVSLFVIRDATGRKRIEAESAALASQNHQLRKNESLNRMAEAIAHNFNNLLTAVVANLDIALKSLLPDAQPARYINHAMLAAYRAADVNNLMLTYLGQTPGERAWVDLSEICRQCLPQLQAAMGSAILITTGLPTHGPIISADAGQIQRILTNLFTNAQEALEKDSGAISVSVERITATDIPAGYPIGWKPKEPFYACLNVADEGCGIPAKDFDKLFDPFFSTKFTGRGLGMPVVLGILKAHGGAIAVESEPGGGSCIRVFLPCV